jgi:hypothetical protein
MRKEATTLKIRGSGACFSFDGYDCINKLCDFLLRDKTNRYSTVIAHNGSGYDNKLILNWATKHGTYPQQYIRQGSRITYKTCRTKHARFIDSLSFAPRPFARLARSVRGG